MRLPILRGPLRGRWYLPESGGKVLRVIAGTYEVEHTEAFRKWIRPGDVVLDVGAHTGYYTLLASSLVGRTGSVWAFEPHPVNCGFLRRHIAINHIINSHVEETAITDRSRSMSFESGRGSGTGRLSDGGHLTVAATSIDEFCNARQIRPTAIKIDVEGAELDVLRGAATVLGTSRPTLFLSTHGAEVHTRCLETLAGYGYTIEPINADTVAAATEVLAIARERARPRG